MTDKVQTITLHNPRYDFPRKTTTYDPHSRNIATVFVVNKIDAVFDSYTTEQFIKALNRKEFKSQYDWQEFFFFTDKAKALTFQKECHKEVMEDENVDLELI